MLIMVVMLSLGMFVMIVMFIMVVMLSLGMFVMIVMLIMRPTLFVGDWLNACCYHNASTIKT